MLNSGSYEKPKTNLFTKDFEDFIQCLNKLQKIQSKRKK